MRRLLPILASLLDRNGGEASQLTDVKGRLQGYEWSPDSKHRYLKNPPKATTEAGKGGQ